MSKIALSVALITDRRQDGSYARVAELLRKLGNLDKSCLLWRVCDAHYGWVLGAASSRATHHLMLWDTVYICDNLVPFIYQLADIRLTQPVSLITTSAAATQARLTGGYWVRSQNFTYGGLLIPQPLLHAFIEWATSSDYLSLFNQWLRESNRYLYKLALSVVQYHHTDSLWKRRQVCAPYFISNPLWINDWTRGLTSPVSE